MSNLVQTAEKEMLRREILELCEQAAPMGAGLPVLKAALRRSGHALTEQEVRIQVGYLEGKGLVKVDTVENERLGIRRSIVSLTPEGMDYLEGAGPDVEGIG